MNAKNQMIEAVMNRAMKGLHLGRPKGTIEEIEMFRKKFFPLAEWAVDRVPKTFSSTVGAAALKAAVFYGMEKAESFCDRLTKGIFDGIDDPIHLLWQSLTKKRGKENVIENYLRCICAVKAFCRNKKLKKLSFSKIDIFEWEEGLKVPPHLEESTEMVLEKLKPLTV